MFYFLTARAEETGILAGNFSGRLYCTVQAGIEYKAGLIRTYVCTILLKGRKVVQYVLSSVRTVS